MKKTTINRRKTSYFSELANQLNDNQLALEQYVRLPYGLESFKSQIDLKKESYSLENRRTLHRVLTDQLSTYFSHDKVKKNVDLLLNEKTFTVTSGHQLNLYGGPLYLIYKIIDSVRLAEELSKRYTDYNFVPMFWMATEDHDFAEINHLYLFNDKFSWESEQVGPVGRFNLAGFSEFKDSILEKFQNNPEFQDYLNSFYSKGTLAQATTEFLMDLVGELGVVILDADHSDLKKLYVPYIEQEIETQFSVKTIENTTKSLEKDGYFGQAHARPINLFYIKDQLRERIIPLENGDLEIGGETFTKSEVLQELNEHPERFSPNVVLRPLYQEVVLPNLCYLGGGGEMAYWLQLKAMFESANIPFPLIKVRNSLQWIDKTTTKRMEKLNLGVEDIFKSIHEVEKQFVFENSGEELNFDSLDMQVNELVSTLEETMLSVNKGLEGYAKGETIRLQKQVDSIKQKLIREQKKQNEDAMKQIASIYDKMFPGNGLQERYENMIPYLFKYGKQEYIQTLYQFIDNPFETDLIIVVEE